MSFLQIIASRFWGLRQHLSLHLVPLHSTPSLTRLLPLSLPTPAVLAGQVVPSAAPVDVRLPAVGREGADLEGLPPPHDEDASSSGDDMDSDDEQIHNRLQSAALVGIDSSWTECSAAPQPRTQPLCGASL